MDAKVFCSSPLSQVSTAPSTPDARFSINPPPSQNVSTPGGTPCFMLPELDDFAPDLSAVVARRPRHERRTRAARALCASRPCPPRVMTLLFVDIDGVLNVGVRDGKSNPLAINRDNLQMLARLEKLGHTDDAESQMLSAAGSEKADGEELTYAELCKDSGDFVDAFVDRFVQLLQTVGPSAKVVLTSTWRLPKHAEKLASLEKTISKKLCKTFKFDLRTASQEADSPEGRLRGISRFLREYLPGQKINAITQLRALVLEDFHMHPLDVLSCDGKPMSCVEEVEKYLESHMPENTVRVAKLIHTYSEWKTLTGDCIRAGSGLTWHHFESAMKFLCAVPQGSRR
eukprot:TRINITY_DN15871_c0_g1_i1.p1 TRINITY_DN15871_c0_g1~~TRINITY_DN15871_c0_g1_i1.p1  ORF type:complete len:378 (-),score=57.30 TRINITY_DN15871_c0_g1_i1:74-1102(-)